MKVAYCMYPLSSCKAAIFRNYGISVYIYIYNQIIMMIYSISFNSTFIQGKIGGGRTSVQPEVGKVSNLHWFGVYTAACWACHVVAFFTTFHTPFSMPFTRPASRFTLGRNRNHKILTWEAVCMSHIYLATFQWLSRFNHLGPTSTSDGDHEILDYIDILAWNISSMYTSLKMVWRTCLHFFEQPTLTTLFL